MVGLTNGALERMLRNEEVTKAVLQITSLKRIEGNQGGPVRYRISLNDGLHTTSSALLSTQKSEAALKGELEQYAVIEVSEFLCNTVQNRRLIILIEFNVMIRGEDVGEELGSPTPLDMSSITENANGSAVNGTSGGQDRPAPPPQQRQPPILRDGPGAPSGPKTVAVSYPTGGNVAASAGPPPNVFPLASVTPYQTKWCVRARVTKRYPIKTYHNSRGEGKLFSVDLADESGEMRATGFNQECEKFYEFLKEGAVYYIKGGSIRSANKQYTSINNDYELTFNNDTQIEPCFDDNIYQLPTVTFNFLKLDKLPNAPRDRVIDVIGVVESFSQCQNLTSRKTNQELKKRDIRLVDDTLNSVSLTLWGADAEEFNPDGHPIAAIKGVRISDFNGLSLSAVQGSQVHLNPDVPEAHRLRGWYDSKGHDAPVTSLTTSSGMGQGGRSNNYTPIALAEADRLGMGDKPDFYTTKAFVNSIRKENCLYKACPTEDCNKKLIDQGTGSHRCERCNKEFSSFKWRMMLQMTICDFSGVQPIALFNEQAEFIVGMPAQELADMRERNETEFNEAMDKMLFKQYTFRLRAKADMYNDEMRVKVMCNRIDELNITEYNKFLIEEIKKLRSMSDPL